jgi:hypothetical protein
VAGRRHQLDAQSNKRRVRWCWRRPRCSAISHASARRAAASCVKHHPSFTLFLRICHAPFQSAP